MIKEESYKESARVCEVISELKDSQGFWPTVRQIGSVIGKSPWGTWFIVRSIYLRGMMPRIMANHYNKNGAFDRYFKYYCECGYTWKTVNSRKKCPKCKGTKLRRMREKNESL